MPTLATRTRSGPVAAAALLLALIGAGPAAAAESPTPSVPHSEESDHGSQGDHAQDHGSAVDHKADHGSEGGDTEGHGSAGDHTAGHGTAEHDDTGGHDATGGHDEGEADTVSTGTRQVVLSGFGAVNAAILGAALVLRRRNLRAGKLLDARRGRR